MEWQGIDWSLVAAVGSAVGAWVAALFARQQVSAARAQNSFSFLDSLGRTWESDDCRALRVEAAQDLLDGKGNHSDALFLLLNRFEEIGLLLERRALDPVVVWSQLSIPILYYHRLCPDAIEAHRKDNSLAWQGFDYAHREMEKIDRKRRGHQLALTQAELRDFLASEVELRERVMAKREEQPNPGIVVPRRPRQLPETEQRPRRPDEERQVPRRPRQPTDQPKQPDKK